MHKLTQVDGHIYLLSFAPQLFKEIYMETGLNFGEFGFVYDGITVEEWVDQEAFKKCTFQLLEREKKNPGYLEQLIEAFERKKDSYMAHVKLLEDKDLDKIHDAELLADFVTFRHHYHNQYALPLIVLFYKEHLSNMLFEKISPKFGDKTAEALSCITTPDGKSFSFEERISMLNIMASIYDSLGKDLFEKNPEEILATLKKDGPQFYEQIVELSHKYFWINNNYRRVFVLGALDFIRKMKDESLSFEHPNDELKLMEDIRKDVLQKKEEYLKQLDDEEKLMSYFLAKGAWWQDERKKYNLIGNHIFMKFLEAISRKTGHPVPLLLNAMMSEIGAVLHGTANMEEIRERHKKPFSMYCKINGSLAEAVVFEPGRRHSEDDVEQVDEFKGMPASLGKVEGDVRVITREEDFKKMKDGAILVSIMTRPEFVPLMKKAAGVLTDEGGMTCHAAVISREFHIPCIVGTKIATRVLKDGDRIQLDASKGIVKILS